jgi:hypothetical protein
MMPVVRISQATWERLQAHARPFEDTPEDVITAALDLLDKKKGFKAAAATAVVEAPLLPPIAVSSGPKTPQKEFRVPLFETLDAMGGRGATRDIRRLMGKKLASRLTDADLDLVSSGDPRWWNAVCWERTKCVKEGLFRRDSERGVWALSDEGKKWLEATKALS